MVSISYWFLAEGNPYPWILAAFISLSYVCAGRKSYKLTLENKVEQENR